jgi:TonB-linked SusC/RagA family outer membrane protein
MNFTAILLLAFCLQLSANTNAQLVTLREKNAPLEKIFSEIRRQTGFEFIAPMQLMKEAPRVTITLQKATIQQALDACLKDLNLTYEIEGNTVIIRKKQKTVLQVADPLVNNQPPPIDIKGRVTNEQGEPIEGATVAVKGTNFMTVTNSNGEFQLTGISENATLEISFVGYETLTIAANNPRFKPGAASPIALKLKPETLNEVIIKKGYYDEKQRFTLGNSVHIGKEVFEQSPVQNPMLALQGRVPGMEVTQLTGLNGGGVKVRIQGESSINFDNNFYNHNPLIVIDGVPFPSQNAGYDPSTGVERIVQGGSPLNFINPNDIESIDILKDADATAIYGSRAANGAILITTKKGQAGKTKLTVNLQQGWGTIGHFVDMLDRRQYLDMRYEAYRNDGIAISTLTPTNTNYDLKLWDTTRYTNWQKELIGGTAKYSNFQAGLSGGTANMSYLIGATYNRQTTVFPGDFDDKVGNLHFNINGASANQRLKIQLTGSYTYDQNHLPGIDVTNRAVLMEPVAPPLFKSDGTLNWAPNASGVSTWDNPLAYTQNTDFVNTTKNLICNLNIRYHILSGLNFQTSFGYTNTQSDLYYPLRIEYARPENRVNTQRTATFDDRNMSSWIIEPQVTYAGKIGKGKIDGLLATTIQKSSYNFFSIEGSGFLTDLLMKTLRAATSTNIKSSLSAITRFNALFGRLGYNWDGKYLINLTARRDGSNKFGPKARFHNFYSVAAGWIFSDEKWISKKLSFLSYGKLRISYGTTGSDGIPDFAYLSIYNINSPTILYQNSIGLYATRIPNPYLQWQETEKSQAGLDLGFIKDRVIVGATYTRNQSFNQLTDFFLPSVAGFTSISKNQMFVVQNTSFEFNLNTVNVRHKNFSWKSNFNLTLPRNKLVEVPDYSSPYYKASLGQPLGYITVTRSAGVNPANGRYLVRDKNGNPITSSPLAEDRNVYLSNLSRYYGGLLNSIQFKGLQLEFLFQFVRKRGPRDMFYSGSQNPGVFNPTTSNQPVSVLDRWQKPGDATEIGRFTTNSLFAKLYNLTDAWYSYEASFIRLKNVSLSWQLPQSWVRKARLQSASIYAHAQNLLTITKYRGLDPESMGLGMPPLRMITTGINVEF